MNDLFYLLPWSVASCNTKQNERTSFSKATVRHLLNVCLQIICDNPFDVLRATYYTLHITHYTLHMFPDTLDRQVPVVVFKLGYMSVSSIHVIGTVNFAYAYIY